MVVKLLLTNFTKFNSLEKHFYNVQKKLTIDFTHYIILDKKGMIIIKDIQYITDIEKLKIISDPLRISILTTLGTEKKNSRQLAKLLKINRTKIHYHLNILEENNFIEVVDTDSINGIVQKYYLPTAQAFVPSPSIFNDLFNNTSVNFNVNKEDVKDFWNEIKILEKKFSSKNKNSVSISIISTAR